MGRRTRRSASLSAAERGAQLTARSEERRLLHGKSAASRARSFHRRLLLPPLHAAFVVLFLLSLSLYYFVSPFPVLASLAA